MTQSRAIQWFSHMASNPPKWMRWSYAPIFALMVFCVTLQRGWVIGAVAAVVYGGVGLAMMLSPGGANRWSRNHPKLDGAILGPLLFLALASITSLSVWWCLLGGVLGTFVGFALGGRRNRLRAGATTTL